MALTLLELLAGKANTPILTELQSQQVTIEPLGGPRTVADVFDRFPESVYQQGQDTHLYRFLTALCGDAGAGVLTKQSYSARLRTEGDTLTFQDLDTFYVQQFEFRRLRSEVYSQDPNSDTLTQGDLDTISAADQSFQHRMMLFFQGLRLGNSPEGLGMMATAGSGVDVEVWENYRYVFDQYSDDPLGLPALGLTADPSEFVLIPRINPVVGGENGDAAGDPDVSLGYTSQIIEQPVYGPVVPSGLSRPATVPKLAYTLTWSTFSG